MDPYADLLHPEPDMDQAAIGVAGQLWSTAPDLLRWGHALAGGVPKVLPAHVVEAMHTVQVMVDRSTWTAAWGLGLILNRHEDRILAGHTGAMPGFYAALFIDRDTRSVTVALANATRGSAIGPVAAEAMDLVLRASPPPPASPWRLAARYPPKLEGVLGRWWSESAETVLTWHHDGLHARLADSPAAAETRLVREDTDLYRGVSGSMRGERLHIHRAPDGQVVHLVWATYPMTRSPR